MNPPNLPPTSELSIDDAPDGFGRDFALLYQDPTMFPVEATAYAWWCLVSAVQLASRHPTAAASPVLKSAIALATAIGEHIATTPPLAEVMAMGWDPTLDQPTDRERPRPAGLILPGH